MHLILDFGHDTDSYAQVLGAMVGAVHGPDIFPASMRDNVETSLKSDYHESIDDWIDTISAAAMSYRE
jgi:ADP-ribosylglycohydrolase